MAAARSTRLNTFIIQYLKDCLSAVFSVLLWSSFLRISAVFSVFDYSAAYKTHVRFFKNSCLFFQKLFLDFWKFMPNFKNSRQIFVKFLRIHVSTFKNPRLHFPKFTSDFSKISHCASPATAVPNHWEMERKKGGSTIGQKKDKKDTLFLHKAYLIITFKALNARHINRTKNGL